MPELPEVETTVRGLARHLHGRTITRVVVNRLDLRRPFPPGLGQLLTGAVVTGLGRRAKYGLVHVDSGWTLVFHLGMSGRWRIDPATPSPHDHLLLEVAAENGLPAHVLALNDARRFGSVDLVATPALAAWPPFAALGPEPVDSAGGCDTLTLAHLATAFAARQSPVKALLLDQKVVAGLGNIYVCEALHRAGLAPTRPGASLTRGEVARLVAQIRAVITEAIAAGGSTIRDYAQPNGELGYFAANWRVYGRAGEKCLGGGGGEAGAGKVPRCPGTIVRGVQSGRSSFWCPCCQR